MTTAGGVSGAGSKAADRFAFLNGGGDVARLIRERDWSDSPLGPIDSWSPSLKAAVAMILPADSQIVMFWGAEFAAL
jgi:hypothetical protein